MNRPIERMNSTGSVVFDGFRAVVWVVTLESSIHAANIRIKHISPGQLYTLIFHQDATGGHTVEWPAEVRNATRINPRPGATSVVNFIGNTGGQLLADLPGGWA